MGLNSYIPENMTIYQQISQQSQQGKKQFAWLVDPDKYSDAYLEHTLAIALKSGVDLVFIGGSLLVDNRVDNCIHIIKNNSDLNFQTDVKPILKIRNPKFNCCPTRIRT